MTTLAFLVLFIWAILDGGNAMMFIASGLFAIAAEINFAVYRYLKYRK